MSSAAAAPHAAIAIQAAKIDIEQVAVCAVSRRTESISLRLAPLGRSHQLCRRQPVDYSHLPGGQTVVGCNPMISLGISAWEHAELESVTGGVES